MMHSENRGVDMKEKIGSMLIAIVSHFWIFVKRIYVFILPFGSSYIIAIGCAWLLSEGLRSLGIPQDIVKTVYRILLTIAPIIPTGVYTLCEEADLYNEFSMDLCFVVWIGTIVYAWKFL